MKKIVIVSMVAAASLGLAACGTKAPIDNVATANELMVNDTDATVTNLGDAPVDANATGNVVAMDAPANVM